MMFNEPSCGHWITGEVYRIDAHRLKKLDRLESLGKPGNFRIALEVVPLSFRQTVRAFAYMKSRDLAEGAYHSDLLESYEDDRFVAPSRR
jgi:gamma-glutamylaminecyclotransferase